MYVMTQVQLEWDGLIFPCMAVMELYFLYELSLISIFGFTNMSLTLAQPLFVNS